MRNQYLLDRIEGIRRMLIAAHQAGTPFSSASKGTERAAFIDGFLREVMPKPFRFGSGDAIDSHGNKSGQLDVVVEYPFSPSLPLPGGSERLYLAEAVAAVVEVKSDVASQWDEAVKTANQLAQLKRKFGGALTIGHKPDERIPLYVVGFTGWKKIESVKEKLAANASVAGILVIDEGLFAVKQGHSVGTDSLWAFISMLHLSISSLKAVGTNPFDYIR